MNITKALYIKLGEGGLWADDSIKNGRIRFGWKNINIKYIKNNNWEQIKELVEADYKNRGKKTGASNDFNALKNICEANEETVFITFYSGKMYWCTAKSGTISEDDKSKYVLTSIGWSCSDINRSRVFEINQISGRLTKYQIFMGTVCSVGNKIGEYDYLCNIIQGIESHDYEKLINAITELKNALVNPIKNLTPKDFEILVDLIFRNNGWKRTSVLGEVMKFFDIVLEEPFSRKLHGVQIKAACSLQTYEKYVDEFLKKYSEDFSTFFFAVHTPSSTLEKHIEKNEKVKILDIKELSGLVISSGLVDWVLDKTK
jgi:hypothetical protein